VALDDSALMAACYDIARTTGWEPDEPISTSLDAVTPAARRYLETALPHARLLESEGFDPNIVVRASCFIAQNLAIPPMGGDDRWFGNMLEALLMLVWPGTVPTDESRCFLLDLRGGIERWLAES
jgi:hypothetical protein